MENKSYMGSELEIFEQAKKWKNYYGAIIKPYIVNSVLEVGSGIGGTTNLLHNPKVTDWICLEPDKVFSNMLHEKIKMGDLPSNCREINGTIDQLSLEDKFDCILYIDVLEHIEDDRNELIKASAHLNSHGILIVLAPAHEFLFSNFDKTIGHFRRYTKRSLSTLSPAKCKMIKLFYVDSAGLLISLANKLVLKQNMPTLRQVIFWDKIIIPVSKTLDKILNFYIGKTVIGIWRYED